jgi:hypothetical protein
MCKNGAVIQLDLNRKEIKGLSEEIMAAIRILSNLEELNFGKWK